MIARLTLTMGPRTVVALLGEDLKWRCEDLLTQSYLNACHGPPEEDTLSMGPVGYHQAVRASRAVQEAGWDVTLYMPALNQSAA
ncbi:MAG TPA: hypothetical protein PL151_16515 [Phycisphaerae bacterium]|nr:hypothetical protein [Phycisphaerae bacterium]HOJ75352.1 hypothetical protein [Phycisphaerae bacterium]HOM52591.1 hypothetical protein [Phycisphaerae bacterium]HPP27864.1 hypothetical protein [Phycisphaerae bacterium]HPU27570.1 hypothetical protein [Phycisphaerae bacterium]